MGCLWSVKHGTHWWISQNAKSHSTAPSSRPVYLVVSNWRDYLWQVHHGALSLDAHVLLIFGPPLYDDEELEATPKDERGNHFWLVGANPLSVVVPVCLSRKRQMVDDHGPTPKRYKKEMPLNTAHIQTPVSRCSICSMFPMWITGTKPHGT